MRYYVANNCLKIYIFLLMQLDRNLLNTLEVRKEKILQIEVFVSHFLSFSFLHLHLLDLIKKFHIYCLIIEIIWKCRS